MAGILKRLGVGVLFILSSITIPLSVINTLVDFSLGDYAGLGQLASVMEFILVLFLWALFLFFVYMPGIFPYLDGLSGGILCNAFAGSEKGGFYGKRKGRV